jgi:tyrosine-protein kinase Etk/Wzc
MLAMGGKRVVLLEFDLRKPKFSSYLKCYNNEGISTFLIDKIGNKETFTKPVPEIENLFFLSSGPLPPNPAELIKSERTEALFSELKQNFDYVIIDVPPVGLVTDALLLSPYADVTLYVVRLGYTFKNQLDLVNELYIQEKLSRLSLVINDVKKQKSYGYGYGYGYGYENINSNKNESVFKKIWSRVSP